MVKYDKNWNRLGHASLCGANTTVPFDAGGMDFAEYGGYLYIRTSHEMYTSSDGLNHQANLTVNIRIADMEITDSLCSILNRNYGYVSHSFNQFIAVDEAAKTIVALDHGDALPRSVVLFKYNAPAGQDSFLDGYRPVQMVDVLTISDPNEYHYNDTGVSVGGLEISDSAYLTVGTSVDQDPGKYTPYGQRNVYLTVTKKDLSETKQIWLTDYAADQDVPVNNPYIVRLSGDRFMIIWSARENGAAMYHVLVDGNGTLLEEAHIQKIDGDSWLSDCQPIVADGKVIWYMTDWSAPKFFTIDVDGGALEPAVPDGEEPKPTVPDEEESEPSNPFVDVEAGIYYYEPVLWAVENQITNGVDTTHFGPEIGCSRAHVVTFLWRYLGEEEPEDTTPAFTDVVPNEYYIKAVAWAVENRVTEGVGGGRFAPEETCTRGQVVTFLYRAAA